MKNHDNATPEQVAWLEQYVYSQGCRVTTGHLLSLTQWTERRIRSAASRANLVSYRDEIGGYCHAAFAPLEDVEDCIATLRASAAGNAERADRLAMVLLDRDVE